MPIINNQRPGVYSRYDASSAYTSPRSGGYAAVIAKSGGGETGKLYTFTGTAALAEAFPADSEGESLRGCVQILLQSGVSKVYAVAVDDSYADALALIEREENIEAVICDCEDEADLAALKASVLASSGALRERVAYCGADTGAKALAAAEAMNCERVVVCCPAAACVNGGNVSAAYSAAALAGAALAKNDPAFNFSGETLATLAPPARLDESEVQALLAAGVTVLEESSGTTEIVRALTTRTKTGNETDYALRGLNAILCIDDVMQSVRAALKAVLRGGRLPGGSLAAVRSQVAVVLADKTDDGVIESYEPPKVTTHSEDPTVCIVELAFRIAHVISQIHVTAHIQV